MTDTPIQMSDTSFEEKYPFPPPIHFLSSAHPPTSSIIWTLITKNQFYILQPWDSKCEEDEKEMNIYKWKGQGLTLR